VSLGTLWSDAQEYDSLAEMEKTCERVFTRKLRRMRSFYNCAATLPTSKPLQYVYCWEPGFVDQILGFIDQTPNAFDVMHVEHLRGAIYGIKLKAFLEEKNLSIPVVWDSVDSIYHLFRQSSQKSRQILKRWITQFELARTEKYEHFLAKQFSHVLVTSPVDREHFLSLGNGDQRIAADRISILPNGVDLNYFHPLDGSEREADTLVVSGKMSYHANISMTLFLVNEIMPLVWAERPDVKLWIVGKDPTREIVRLAENPLITVTGTVPDLRVYLQRATVAVAPIVYGAGIQNKVLEAMACATPVITHPQALSALEAVVGRDLEQATAPVEYAKKILHILNDIEYQRTLGEAGRKYVETHHRWSSITEKLINIYHQMKLL
jgi:glycosyltransferase involved in cell wall biosynthesis